MIEENSARPARPDEQPALEGILRRASLAESRYREQLLAHPEVLELPVEQIVAGRVFVSDMDRKPAGFCVVVPASAGEHELEGLFVDPPFWGRGIGRLLVGHAAAIAAGMGAKRMSVIAGHEARGFYEKCGFAVTGETHTQFAPALVMHLMLDAAAGGQE
ncbi:GNAT family N-acetyltransferase [Neoaquamicrobium sediminum]|uniref:GNAT family N-acetyltransferase n=1 Tax=Neoaquamicrobium sediminum TaxID=1849104 RepID=UPI0015665FAD|nr:GNAT family N-acetyltransferase [Mesorhizobium sediminum]NRC56752.1 GNAT family N-acetyltransferase [Mesorhizobium sediminum]